MQCVQRHREEARGGDVSELVCDYRTSDDAVFKVRAHSPSIESITSVTWRGIDLCADCWLHELEDDERALLESILTAEAKRRKKEPRNG